MVLWSCASQPFVTVQSVFPRRNCFRPFDQRLPREGLVCHTLQKGMGTAYSSSDKHFLALSTSLSIMDLISMLLIE